MRDDAAAPPGSLLERVLLPVVPLTRFGRRLLEEGFAQPVEDDRPSLAALDG